MNEKDALLATIMSLSVEKREELWSELVRRGLIRDEVTA